MTGELWDLTDVDGTPTGVTHRRGDPVPPGAFHIVSSVCAIRGDGRILLTQRAATKTYPMEWEIPAGSALTGESSAQAAVRELGEETGLAVTTEALEPVGRVIEANALVDVYVARVPDDAAVVPDPEEVAGSRWATLAELDALVAAGGMAEPWIERLEQLREPLGALVGAAAVQEAAS